PGEGPSIFNYCRPVMLSVQPVRNLHRQLGQLHRPHRIGEPRFTAPCFEKSAKGEPVEAHRLSPHHCRALRAYLRQQLSEQGCRRVNLLEDFHEPAVSAFRDTLQVLLVPWEIAGWRFRIRAAFTHPQVPFEIVPSSSELPSPRPSRPSAPGRESGSSDR